jgi:HSP20 family molecular chaperone IbpA
VGFKKILYAQWRYFMNELIPFSNLGSLIDKVFHTDDWFSDWGRIFDSEIGGYHPTTQIPVDVVLKENRDLEVSAAIAGYPEDSISIDFDGDYLSISVDKKEKKEDNGDRFICRGIKQSSAKVKLYVPSSRYDNAIAKASLKNGILKISLPAREEARSHKIPINKE